MKTFGPDLITVTGRNIGGLPDTTSPRKFDEWRIAQAVAEAESREDDFNLTWIRQLRPRHISDGHSQAIHDYLFVFAPVYEEAWVRILRRKD